MQRPTVLTVLRVISEILEQKGIESARLEAEVLISHLLGISRADLYTQPQRRLKEEELLVLREMVQRRLEGEPVAYIVGEKEFWSLKLKVNPSCLIPRPETELLVEEALKVSASLGKPLKILEIGTGCGAIAIALARELGDAQIWATEISPYALQVAKENVERHGLGKRIKLLQADLYPPERGFSLIVSNPPYIPTQDLFKLPPEVRDYEPLEALNGGPDGLSIIRRILQGVGEYLVCGGWLLLEVGYGQAEEVMALFREGGFSEVETVRDYNGIKRVVKGRRS